MCIPRRIPRLLSPWGAALTIAVPLPPRAPVSVAVVAWAALLAGPCLTDGQGPSPLRCPVEPVNGRLGLPGVGHLDKAKASRPAGLAIGDDPGALDNALCFEQLAQLFFGRGKHQICDVDVHSVLSQGTCLSCLVILVPTGGLPTARVVSLRASRVVARCCTGRRLRYGGGARIAPCQRSHAHGGRGYQGQSAWRRRGIAGLCPASHASSHVTVAAGGLERRCGVAAVCCVSRV